MTQLPAVAKFDGSKSVKDMQAITRDGKSVKGLAALSTMLQERKGTIGQVAPSFMNTDHIIKVAINNFTDPKKAKLYECTGESIFRAVMQAAELGLDPGGVLGLAHLVPYGRECTMLIDYKGLVELCYRSGKVKSISVFPVYETDQYNLVLGRNAGVFDHKPDLKSQRKKTEVLFVYAYIELTDGGYKFDYMTISEIESIRARSKAGGNGPWVTDWLEMAKKTVLRRLLKSTPKSIEMQKALAIDNAQDTGEKLIDVTFDVAGDLELPEVTVDTSTVREKVTKGRTAPANVNADTGEIIDVEISGEVTGLPVNTENLNFDEPGFVEVADPFEGE